jgi:1,4-dihydroxy-2-naphthoyl-CoA hydrolase
VPDPAAFARAGEGRFPGLLGVVPLVLENGRAELRLELRPELLAPNGYLHAGAVVGLADTTCGYGCVASLPEDATGFTTIELKTNFLGTARDGTLTCEAHMFHGGRTTQVWDATVRAGEKTLALFRCTQLLLYASPEGR